MLTPTGRPSHEPAIDWCRAPRPGSGQCTPGPRPIDFLWSQGPYPAADSSYVSCEKPEASGADYCVPGGTWTGLCSTESLATTMKRFDGPLVFQQGVPRIEGCEALTAEP
ncbi:hypothetical protein [Archangium sp.]|uniref:hypothetical protein n=1 Tax=Archangium sp. TaxID=1872627 RepID=UPI00286B571B|nr:hypothetical protein [Archangium sp.]